MAHAMIARCQQIAKRRMESAMPSIDHDIVWIVVGLLGGGLAGALMTWERGGFGLWRNLALGLAGAFIGGLLFRIFGIWPGLDKIAISLRDVVAAVIGSLLVLAVLWLWQKFRTSSEKP
jgi:uncharacterized membrane protein YeaQ/YmgE (transglycosylase-associated protein family)